MRQTLPIEDNHHPSHFSIIPDTVRLGDTDLGSKDDDGFAQDVKIRKFIPHPSYKRTQKYYDIALIELETDARLDAAICPICLWAKEGLQQFSGELQVAGFGVTDYGKPVASNCRIVAFFTEHF